MILFYLKKNFVDGWDNLLWIAVFNICLLLWGALGFFLVSSVAYIPIAALCISLIFVCLSMIPIFSLSDACYKIANFKSVPIRDVFLNFKNVWKNALSFGVVICFVLFTCFIGLPFYFQMYTQNNGFIYLIFVALIFWILLITLFALQWFMPLQTQLGGGLKKNIKKCYILFFDNIGFTIFMGIYTLIIFIMSAFLAFLAPGITGVVLAHNNALRLRMYKYDWFEEHPELSPKEARKQIPWDELIANDKETIGPRDIKSFIFPWK